MTNKNFNQNNLQLFAMNLFSCGGIILTTAVLLTAAFPRALGTSDSYVNCTLPPLCSSRPPTTLQPANEPLYRPREPCKCEHWCRLYEDCCADAPQHVFSRRERQILRREDGEPWSCQRLVPLTIDLNAKTVFMVNWCPPKTNKLMMAKCTRDTSLAIFKYTYLLDVPVVASNSGIIYQNIYCGKCQGEHYFNQYKYVLACDCENLELKDVMMYPYQQGNLTWKASRPLTTRCMHSETVTCILKMDFPEETGHLCEENLINKCSQNVGMFREVLHDGCLNGNNYYLQDKDSNVYKNINCSLCNGKHLNDLICLPPYEVSSSTGVSGHDLWTISDLFSFDDNCDFNHIGDPVFDNCEILEDITDSITNNSLSNGTWLGNSSIFLPQLPGPSRASVFFVVMMSISIVCLLSHIAIFLILFSVRNLHSKNLFSMTCALCMAEIFFVFGANLCNSLASCYLLTIIVYYCFMAAFLWMNVMSFDICKTFQMHGVRTHSSRTFYKYSGYAWGTALVFLLCALLVDGFAPESAVAPSFASRGFWFGNFGGLLLFFVVPVEILFAFNLVMLIVSVKQIVAQKKLGKMAASSVKKIKKSKKDPTNDLDSRPNGDSKNEPKMYSLIRGKLNQSLEEHEEQIKKLKLNASLAVLMGVPWIFAALVNVSVVFEYLFNMVNGLQGVFIFLAFDCKRKVWQDLKLSCSRLPGLSTESVMPMSTDCDKASSSSRDHGSGKGVSAKVKRKLRGDSIASKSTVDTFVSQETTSSTKQRSSPDESHSIKQGNIMNNGDQETSTVFSNEHYHMTRENEEAIYDSDNFSACNLIRTNTAPPTYEETIVQRDHHLDADECTEFIPAGKEADNYLRATEDKNELRPVQNHSSYGHSRNSSGSSNTKDYATKGSQKQRTKKRLKSSQTRQDSQSDGRTRRKNKTSLRRACYSTDEEDSP